MGTLCAHLPDDCWREPQARYVPGVDRLPLEPLETGFSSLSCLFGQNGRKGQIQAALAYTSDRTGQGRAK